MRHVRESEFSCEKKRKKFVEHVYRAVANETSAYLGMISSYDKH